MVREAKKVAKAPALHSVHEAIIDEQAVQCGYCFNGMIIQAAELLSKTPQPTEAEIRTAMNGHLCRCGNYHELSKQSSAHQKNSRELGCRGRRASVAMKSIAISHPLFDRREFLKAGGALIVGAALASLATRRITECRDARQRSGPPDPKQIDTWLAVHANNTATIFIGYVELGQSSTTSLLQIAAEEFDLDMSQVSTIRLDTNLTPNQGGTYRAPPSRAAARRFAPLRPKRDRRSCKWPRNRMRPSNVSLYRRASFRPQRKRWSAKVSHVW